MYNSTIKELINNGKHSTLNTDELSLKTVVTNSLNEKFVVNISCVFEKYYELLTDHAVTVILTNEEYLRYRFKPRMLSKDLYGTYDLHYLLLKLNNITSVIYFDFTELKVFKPEIISLLNEIQILEEENRIDNQMNIIKEINE
jgi:hypothetical protein